MDSNQVEISAEIKRLISVGYNAAGARDAAIDTFVIRWGMCRDEVIDTFIANGF